MKKNYSHFVETDENVFLACKSGDSGNPVEIDQSSGRQTEGKLVRTFGLEVQWFAHCSLVVLINQMESHKTRVQQHE